MLYTFWTFTHLLTEEFDSLDRKKVWMDIEFLRNLQKLYGLGHWFYNLVMMTYSLENRFLWV